jgi:hypothetical protein
MRALVRASLAVGCCSSVDICRPLLGARREGPGAEGGLQYTPGQSRALRASPQPRFGHPVS